MPGRAQLQSETKKHNVSEMDGKHHSWKLFWLKLELVTARSLFKKGKEKEDKEKKER